MTTPSNTPTRERLLDAAVSLMRAKGAAASGTKEILERAGAPRGSFYFHFPEGKDQLVLEAVERAGAETLAGIEQALEREVPLGVKVPEMFEAMATDLVASDYLGGCAVGVTTLESATSSLLFQEAVSRAFATWSSTLTSVLGDGGISQERAVELADGIVAMMEGATLLARAHRDPAPLRHAATMVRLALSAVDEEKPHGTS